MKREAKVVFELGIDPEVAVEFQENLLVSLDCDHCQRARRSVALTLGKATGLCHPGSAARQGGEHPPYPGRLIDLRVERYKEGVRATYHIEYETEEFKDLRYGERSLWTGYPTWARAHFVLSCPMCESDNPSSSQNNLGRPWTNHCSCGFVLYREELEMPLLRWLDPKTNVWRQVAGRFGGDGE